ncbi:MAG: ABC transporter ATP-binding protein [Promethearchaeota archaeon]
MENTESLEKSKNIIQVSDLQKSYISTSETLHVLRGVNLTIKRGEMIGIMGPSGSGKSTLLNIIGLLDAFDEGEYYLAGIEAHTFSQKNRQQIRLQKIGFIFQTFNLIQTLTVQQNIELPMQLLRKPQKEQHKKAIKLLEIFGIESKKNKFPYQLSIGEQQRVAISRALVNDPVLVLCDEPTGNLDEENAKLIQNHLHKLKNFNTAIIIVSHNPAIKQITDKNYILHHGILEEEEVSNK